MLDYHPGQKFPLMHTFSIIAMDKENHQMGVAVQSHWFSVGSVVPWAEAGVGVVVTQSVAELRYGPLGLELMRNRKTASEALKSLLASDQLRDLRQVAMMDEHAEIAVHTGSRCIPESNHQIGKDFSIQANMMLNQDVCPAMAKSFQRSKGTLAERMIKTLEAGQKSGGDIRGQQSASILVVSLKRSRQPWDETILDLRVEDHPDPIRELSRLARLHLAYQKMNLGDACLGRGEIEEALNNYTDAVRLQPDVAELQFWQAVTLADLGKIEAALPIFKNVFLKENGWAELVQRLPAVQLLRDDPQMMKKILNQKKQ